MVERLRVTFFALVHCVLAHCVLAHGVLAHCVLALSVLALGVGALGCDGDGGMDGGVPPMDGATSDAAVEDARVDDARVGDAETPDAEAPDTGVPIDADPVESFGAVGDGTTDDTAAIQAAFDSGRNISFEAGRTYRISAQIDVDQDGDQIVVGNGATVTTTTVLATAFEVDKASGLLTVHDLVFDGNRLAARGWYFLSAFILERCRVFDVYNDSGAAIAYRLDVDDAWSNADFRDCSCDNIVSEGNGEIGDSIGASRCISLYWDYDASPVTVRIDGCELGNVWGDDGDVIDISQRNNSYDSDARLEVRDTTISNAGRRLIKNRSSNTYWENVTFNSPQADNPNLTGTPSAGMIAISRFTADEDTNRHIFNRCTFNGTGFENRVIIVWVDDITISECTFNGADFAIYQRGGGVCFQNNTVDSEFNIYTYGPGPTYTGPIVETGTMPPGDYVNLPGAPPQGSFECPRAIDEGT